MNRPKQTNLTQTNQFGSQAPEDPNAIEQQNEQIRADMSQTLHALEQKLSPGQLVDRALGLVKEHGGEVAANLGHTVKANPVPVVLTLVGLSWLIASQRRPSWSSDGATMGVGPESEEAHSGSSLGEKFQGAKERLGEVRSQLSEGAHSVSERMHDSAASVRETLHSAADRTRAIGDAARRQSARARDTFDHLLHEQPLLLGAIGVAVGAAIGALLPATERENRLMGTARERALHRVREEGDAQYEKLRRTAVHAADAATEAAKDAVEEERAH